MYAHYAKTLGSAPKARAQVEDRKFWDDPRGRMAACALELHCLVSGTSWPTKQY